MVNKALAGVSYQHIDIYTQCFSQNTLRTTGGLLSSADQKGGWPFVGLGRGVKK
jgi:hypothetical protein